MFQTGEAEFLVANIDGQIFKKNNIGSFLIHQAKHTNIHQQLMYVCELPIEPEIVSEEIEEIDTKCNEEWNLNPAEHDSVVNFFCCSTRCKSYIWQRHSSFV